MSFKLNITPSKAKAIASKASQNESKRLKTKERQRKKELVGNLWAA